MRRSTDMLLISPRQAKAVADTAYGTIDGSSETTTPPAICAPMIDVPGWFRTLLVSE